MRFAGSLEQVSPHVLAASIVAGARQRQVALVMPTEVNETPGAGIVGRVDDLDIAVGTVEFVSGDAPIPAWARDVRRPAV